MKAKKEITIYDIADELGISSATVSRALQNHPAIKDATKKKVQQTAQKLGYRQNTFASNLRKQKTNTIGVLVHELNSNFITSVLAGIEKITTEAGYDILITHSSENFEREAANAYNLFNKRVDGVIASLSFETNDLEHFKQFNDKEIPLIFFDRVDENSTNTKVIIDNYKCGYDATQHLIDQGCKKIALITATLKRNVYEQRHKGYKKALSNNKLAYNKDLVLIKDLTEDGAIEAAKEILKMKPLPDGIFITNDFKAAVCMKYLMKHGIKVPEDIAIVGFNNDTICKIVDPQLSTINYPGFQLGEITATNLVNHLKGISDLKTTQTIIVHSELIIRESSIKKRENKRTKE